MKRWFAVFCKTGQERLAEGNLLNQGFTTYLPRLALRKRSGGKNVAVTVPMFPGYLFVQVDLERTPWRAINSTFGVRRIVSFGERPAPLPEGAIEEIRAREDADGIIRLPKVAPFQKGETVEFADGPMSDVKAMFTVPSGTERVIVLMNLLGRQVPVRVDQDRLRRAS
ncbi:MAG: transcription/translation regulatory transformer protein RfaH [Roseitalea porphyridii]